MDELAVLRILPYIASQQHEISENAQLRCVQLEEDLQRLPMQCHVLPSTTGHWLLHT